MKGFVTCLIAGCLQAFVAYGQLSVKTIAPGVTMVSTGELDKFSPYSLHKTTPLLEAMQQLPEGKLPFNPADIKIRTTDRGCVADIPLDWGEHLYGFGLQMGSFEQSGLRKRPVVNDNPLNNLGYTHAPVPMYVSTKGYAVLVNTLRYPTFYCGGVARNADAVLPSNNQNDKPAESAEDLYKNKSNGPSVTVDVQGARGLEIIIFSAANMKDAISRYNLFSGGGALPPLWGLGVKYRVKADFKQEEVMNMARYFRKQHLPISMLGLEPGWQTAAYSCSYVWNRSNFPSPIVLADSLGKMGYTVNLWEHAFVNPSSPLHKPLQNKSGNYLVWNGLVPDFADSSSSALFAAYHDTALIQHGVAGFKLDECDNSNLAYGSATWSFPECSQFPSGISGEQMHQTFGNLYFESLYKPYLQHNKRSYFDIRSLGAFASSYPASLYSDTYDAKGYIQMIPNAGFNGLLWSPEVRESSSVTELLRRTQTAVLSAQTVFNSWYLKSPPWLQFDKGKNNSDQLLPNAAEVEVKMKKLLDARVSLLPYLYTAFAAYAQRGIPPFRGLVVDYPEDKNVWQIDNEYMIGESLLAAPLTGNDSTRKVYLPKGNWYNFNTYEKYEGGKEYRISTPLDQVPLYVKENTILPLAKPVDTITGSTRFDIACYVFGATATPATLYEDDGVSNDYKKGNYTITTMQWKSKKGVVQRSKKEPSRYRITEWKLIP